MNAEMRQAWAKFYRYAQAFVLVGSAIAYCPAWSGDWTRSHVQLWIGSVVAMAVMVWLSNLSNCLRRDGHGIHAALVIVLMFPLFHILSSMAQGRDVVVSPLYVAVNGLFGGSIGLCGLAVLVVAAIFETIGRKSGWTRFKSLGPEPGWESR